MLQLNSFEHFALRDDGTFPHNARAPHALTLLVSQRGTSAVENSLPNIYTSFLKIHNICFNTCSDSL